MGQVVKPNLALLTSLILRILEEAANDCRRSDKSGNVELIVFGVHALTSYVISLRGSEVLMLDLTVINRELKISRDCCAVALKGKVKGDSVDQDHLFHCIFKPSSGIEVEKWLRILSSVHLMFERSGEVELQITREKSYR